MNRKLLSTMMTALLSLTVVAADGAAQEKKKEEKKKADHYAAVAVAVRGVAAAGSINLDFRINEYTSDEKINEYLDILKEGSVEALRRALEKVDVGQVSPTGRVGTPIAVARARKTERGTLITIVTARYMPFFELYRSGRSTDYPFGVFQMLVDEKGQGEGMAIIAARIKFDKEGALIIESYGHLDTVRLSNVRRY